jgi:hypothetical protein
MISHYPRLTETNRRGAKGRGCILSDLPAATQREGAA